MKLFGIDLNAVAIGVFIILLAYGIIDGNRWFLLSSSLVGLPLNIICSMHTGGFFKKHQWLEWVGRFPAQEKKVVVKENDDYYLERNKM